MSRSENKLILVMLALGIISVLFLLINADVIQFESGMTGRASAGITGLASGEFGTQEETFSAEPVPNQPPAFNGGSLSTPLDTPLTTDLSQLFADPEGAALTFIATSEDVIYVSIDGSIATFTPAQGFQGERTLTIIATDGTDVLRQPVKMTVGDASAAVSEPVAPEGPAVPEQETVTPETLEELAFAEDNQTAEEPQPELGAQEFTAAVALSGCATINQSSELTQNVDSIGTCIIFNNDNITLDCDGFVITYDLAGDSNIAGIDAAHRRNITIRDCIIQKNTTNGSEASSINFTNTTDSFIINNTILTNGSGSFRAVFLQNLSSRNLVSNNTIRNNASGSTVYGLQIWNTTGNIITGNTIVTNCSSSCYGIVQVLYASNETTYQYNVITAGNRFGSSSGMLITAANGLTITDNNITTIRGGTFSDSNRGIEIPSSVSNATIARNIIRTNGGSSNIGIYFTGDDGNITANDVRTNGSSTDNYGVLLSGARVRVEHNLIVSGGIDSNHGIRMLGSNATVTNNSVNTTGRRLSDGLDVSSMTDARVENNTIITRGNQSNHDGISLSFSTQNVFRGNSIVVTAAPGVINNTHGVNIDSSSHNNTFSFTNITTTGISSFGVRINGAADIVFNATLFGDVPHWINSAAGTLANFTNTTFADSGGSINIVGSFLINGTQNVTGSRLVVGQNSAFLNAALLPFLNQSAIITLVNLTSVNARPTVDPEDDGTFVRCAADRCTLLSYGGGTLVFSATSFTNYSSIDVQVELVKTDNPDPVNASEFLNYSITVNVTSGSASNVTLTDIYPSQVIFQSSQPPPEPGTNNTFIIGNLTENQTFITNITVLVRNLSDDTALNNTANISFVNSTGDIVSLTVSELTSAEATDVGCPVTINTSTALAQSITGTGTCVTFGASNVVLDCAGNTITYGTMGGNDSYGAVATNRQNVTVVNCNIRKGNVNGVRGYGITLFNTSVALLENNTITTNGSNENDGIHVGPGSGPTGRVELVRNANNLNNPFCTNPSNVNFCKVCYFPVIGVACTTLGLNGCQDGEGFKTQDIVSFNLSSIPTGGRMQVIGGEVVRCSLNNNLVLSFYARNTCGALRSANIPGSFYVVGENNLTCSVSGSGGDEDNGFKLSAFSYELPSPVQGVFIINNTVVSDGGNLSHGIFLAASNSTIRANTVLTTGEERGHAVFLEFSSGSNNVSDNTLTTQASGGNALHAFAAVMNNFTNNTIVSAARASAHLEEALNNTFGLSFLPTSTSLFVSEPNASINYTEPVNFSNTTNIADIVSIGFNSTRVNATGSLGQQLNHSALLTFIGLPADGVLAVFDAEDDGTFDDCNAPRCANSSYNATGGVLTYNVSSFTTYAAEEISACAVLDLDTFTNQSNATFRLRNNVSANGDCYSIVEENITLDCAGFTIRGVGTGFGVFANTTRNILVENCTILNFEGNIVFTGVNNSIIRNNSALNSTSSSIQVNNSQNVTVSGNNATIRTVLSTVLGAIHVAGSTGVMISNNTASTNSSTIFLTSARHGIVAENNATSSGGVGIELSSAHNNTLFRNRAAGPNGGIAIRVTDGHNNTIDGNNATSDNGGIAVSGTGALDENATCRANNIYNNSVVATGAGTAISITRCVGNYVVDNNGTATGSGKGIDITDSSYHVLVDNNGTGFSGNGIECGGTLGVATAGFGTLVTELTGGACNSNRLENNNGTSVGGTGILLTRAANNTISNNTGISQNRSGIALIGGNDNTFENNNGTSRLSQGIALDLQVEAGFGGDESFAIEAFNGKWNELGEEHFSPQPAPGYRYSTKAIEMPEGTTRVRLTHDGGTDTAHIDAVLLDGNAPVSAHDLNTGEDIPPRKLSAADYDVIDAHARPIELSWSEPGSLLIMSAIEEDLVGVPTVWPANGFANYTLGSVQEYEYRVVPYSSHPVGTVYAAISTWDGMLRLSLDRTTDNTLDYGGDWAQLRVSSDAGVRSFTISASETTWGTSAYEYTDKVAWQHKTYDFTIPFGELGLAQGDTMQFQVGYYGTEGGGGGGTIIACVNNTLRNNIGLSIHGFGINMSRCNNNTLINNTAVSANNTAFHLRNSSNNVFINNTAVADNGTALHAVNGSNNTFVNTTIQAASGSALVLQGGLTTFTSSGNFCTGDPDCTGGEVCNVDANVCVNPNENLTIKACVNTTLDHNRISSAGAVAVSLADCHNSTIRHNRGEAGATALLLANANNTQFINNTWAVSTGVAVRLGASASDSFDRTTVLSNATWLFSDGTISAITFLNTTFDAVLGSINTLPSVSLPASANVSQATLNITQNRAFLNSSTHAFLNVTSIVTLRNLSFGNPQPLVDFNDTGNFVNCNASQCTRLSFANGTLVFNVTTFTTYSSEEGGVNITLTKTDNPDPVNTGGGLNYTITVTVVASNASNITLTDTYPPQVVFNTAQPAPLAGTNDTFIIGNLTGGQSFTVNITVNVTSGITNGTVINNTANISFQNSTGNVITANVTENTTVVTQVLALTNCPVTINVSTTLTQNLSANLSDDQACITFGNSSIFLDCAGLVITLNASGMGVLAPNVTNATTQNCLVQNAGRGIMLENANSSVVHNSTVLNATLIGIGVSGGRFVRIENNTAAQNIAAGGTILSGIYLNATQYGNVTNNNATGRNGINLGSFDNEVSSGIVLRDNTGTGTDGTGFGGSDSGSVNITLINNTGRSSTSNGFGLTLNNSAMIDNRGFSTSLHGIFLRFGFRTNLTGNNGTSTSGVGILVEDGGNNTLADNVGQSNSSAAIRLTRGADNAVLRNNGTSNFSAGISIQHGSGHVLRENIGRGEMPPASDGGGGGGGVTGIALENVNFTVLINNLGLSNASRGIGLSNGSQFNNLTGNNGTSNFSAGIGLSQNSNSNILSNNTARSLNNAALNISGAASNVLLNNTFSVNNGTAVLFEGAATNNVFGNSTLYTNGTWLLSGGSASGNNLTNTLFEGQNGSIRIFPNTTMPVSTNVSVNTLRITYNASFLNSTTHGFLNLSGQVTLRNITASNPEPVSDFEDDGTFVTCPASICQEVSFAGGVFVFNVTGFTTHAAGETVALTNVSNITVTKTDSPDPVNASSSLTYQINVTVSGSSTAFNVTVNDTYPAQAIFSSGQPTPVSGTNNTFVLGNLSANQSVLVNITVLVPNLANGTVINNSVNVTFQNETSALLSAIDAESTTVLNPQLINTSIINSTVNNSNLTNCIVINSTVINSIKANCTIINSVVVDSNNTNASIIDSTESNSTDTNTNVGNSTIINSSKLNSNINASNVTNSNVTNGTITGSNITNSNLTNCIIINSTITSSVKTNCTIINSNIAGSTNNNVTIINTNETNSTDFNTQATFSSIVNSSKLNSNVSNSTANQSTITNSTLVNSTVINSNVTNSNLTNCVVINSSLNYIDASNCAITNATLPQLNFSNISVSKADLQDPVENNTQLNYTITVTSSGTETAFNVTLTETYPPQVIFNTAQPSPSSGNTTFILGNLSAGIVVVVNITVNVTGGLANSTVINNSVNVTFQNSTSALLSVVDVESTTVQNTSTVSAGAPSTGGGGGGGGGFSGGVISPQPQVPALITGACTESWACEGWSACADGKEVRTCVDLSNCGTTNYLPLTERSCAVPVVEPELIVLPEPQAVVEQEAPPVVEVPLLARICAIMPIVLDAILAFLAAIVLVAIFLTPEQRRKARWNLLTEVTAIVALLAALLQFALCREFLPWQYLALAILALFIILIWLSEKLGRTKIPFVPKQVSAPKPARVPHQTRSGFLHWLLHPPRPVRRERVRPEPQVPAAEYVPAPASPKLPRPARIPKPALPERRQSGWFGRRAPEQKAADASPDDLARRLQELRKRAKQLKRGLNKL